ncbi:hypothetical protein [Sedimenticola selenatireducens]|uniref:hypothetical protein n=1 Tax=Sedimenticola selenatireducens TaxID=191960 RepID=UPI00048B495A|nr:hypothetical protein [Sedimenticola selenatireducens]
MLLNPAIMALILVSFVVLLMLLVAAGFAIHLLRFWDMASGSERQLRLERRTYLISTLLAWAFAAELVSLLLYVYNAESMSGQFVGAMCATGVLNVNAWGWPTLFLKVAVFFSGATWLTLNALDNRGYDYPLIRFKYGLLLLLVPLVATETWLQLRYFLELQPDVITSCCGSLFSANDRGVAGEVAAVSPRWAMWSLYLSGALVLLAGLFYHRTRRGGLLFGLFAMVAFLIALVAIVSVISPYIYAHPEHHCPFCILKSGHGFAGYLLYIPLFAATAWALGVAVVSPWQRISSLSEAVSTSGTRLVRRSLMMFVIFYLSASGFVYNSTLVMQGVWW